MNLDVMNIGNLKSDIMGNKPLRRRILPKSVQKVTMQRPTIEIVKKILQKYRENPKELTMDEQKLLEDYIVDKLVKANPLSLSKGLIDNFGTAFNFYLRIGKYNKVLELYARFRDLIKNTEYDNRAYFMHFFIISKIKLNQIDDARILLRAVMQRAEEMESTDIIKEYYKKLFEEYDIDPKLFGL